MTTDMINAIPSYELYGDLLADGLPGPIHHESIKERSSRHNWTIRFHRHRHLAQIFLFSSPDVTLRLGDIKHTSTDKTILVIPPGVAHGFQFSEDVVGDVVSIRLAQMPDTLKQRFAMFNTATDGIFTRAGASHFCNITTLVAQLRDAYRSVAFNKTEILTSLVDLITLYLAADLKRNNIMQPVHSSTPRSRHDMQVEKFCNLLEENFQQAWTVSDYAERIGISAPHLTRVCKSELGSPPNDLVRQRRILEAKRLLEYTALTVFEIAHRCGFRDAAFFSRSFKSTIGIPPYQYRKQLDK